MLTKLSSPLHHLNTNSPVRVALPKRPPKKIIEDCRTRSSQNGLGRASKDRNGLQKARYGGCIPVAGETPSSDAVQAIRVCMCPCLGWADGSRTYPQALVRMDVASGMC